MEPSRNQVSLTPKNADVPSDLRISPDHFMDGTIRWFRRNHFKNEEVPHRLTIFGATLLSIKILQLEQGDRWTGDLCRILGEARPARPDHKARAGPGFPLGSGQDAGAQSKSIGRGRSHVFTRGA